MRVLAVETSTLAGGVAALDGDRLVGSYLLDVRVTHSERLMLAVDRVLTDAGWTVDDVEGLAVAVGPGSFTGLRIGLGTVKGLALALSVPIAAVPTLDAMAATLPFARLPVCPVVEGRKGEVYVSRYRWDGTAMCREWDYVALPVADLVTRLGGPVILTGPAAAEVAAAAPEVGAWLVPAALRMPSPAMVGTLGIASLRRGEATPAADLAPLYLGPSQAERRRYGVAVH